MMLIFFDESFRDTSTHPVRSTGTLCGIAIPEKVLHQIVVDVYQIKYNNLGEHYAKEKEIKGKDLFKNFVFNLEAKGTKSKNLLLANDLLDYISSKELKIFGCISFEQNSQAFQCQNVIALDKTFRYLFERIDVYMKKEKDSCLAKIIFDDRGYSINKLNSEAITNFFVRSPQGLAMNSIMKVPLFAISQAQNIGIQLADFVTSIISLRFSGEKKIDPYWKKLKPCIYRWKHENGITNTSIKVIKNKNGLGDSPESRQDKKA